MTAKTNRAILPGRSLAGDSYSRKRVADDFYATPESATRAILDREYVAYPALEPACGKGHIAKLLGQPTIATDLVDRGYGKGGRDFLNDKWFENLNIGTVITNPPFNLFQEFARRGLQIAKSKVILFGKIQALEGQKRATFLESSPLKNIYVFKKRVNPLRSGLPVDENGKPWASTMCFAWFVWELNYTGEPVVRWL